MHAPDTENWTVVAQGDQPVISTGCTCGHEDCGFVMYVNGEADRITTRGYDA